ncbi:MAG: ABC transporter transmembrane domain-containing protein, partial [Limosilactobacillus oris]
MIDRELFQLAGAKSISRKLAGLDVLQAFLIVGQALALSAVITQLWRGHALNWPLLLAFAACFTGRQLLNWLSERWLDHYAGQTAQVLRRRLLSKLFQQGPALVQAQGTGSMITMVLDGVAEVRQYIKLIFSKTLTMMIVPVIVLVAAGFLDLRSAIILLIMYPLIVMFMIILGKAAQAKAEKQFGNFQKLSNNFIDSLRGIATLKYLGLSKRYSRSIFNSSEHFRERTMRVLKIAMLSTFALDFFTTLSIAVIAVYLGFDLIKGKIDLYPALAVLILAPEYFLPIRNFASDFHATLNGKNSFKRIHQLINRPVAPTADLSLHEWQAGDELKLDQVQFKYPNAVAIAPLSQTVVTDGGTTDVATIAANVMPAIVQVTNVSIEQYRSIFGQSQNKESTSAGSGIIVSQDDAYTYIATNNHVVANSSELTITFVDGKTAAAQVVGVDAQHDLAVVKVKTSDMDSSTVSAIKIATLGDSDSVKVGQAAIVIGNALGYGQ